MTTQLIVTQLVLQLNIALGLAVICLMVNCFLNQDARQRFTVVAIPVKVYEECL
jgi:hypothetical protein